MAKVENENTYDPIQLAWMVNQVVQLAQVRDLAKQPPSPSTKVDGVVSVFILHFSYSTLFTIRASRMGSEAREEAARRQRPRQTPSDCRVNVKDRGRYV